MIGSAITAALPFMRAQAESLMTSVCTIDRQVTTWDEVEQKSVTAWSTVHADIPCHLDEPAATSRQLLTEQAVTLESPMVQVPLAFDGIEPDDRVTVTGAGVLWVTRSAPDDTTHPVERLVQCRWVR